MALATGIDLLPGAALGFGLAGTLSPLAAARVEGGGMVAGSAAAVNAGGSAGSLGGALFAGLAARAPFAHHVLATSQPFYALLPLWATNSSSPASSSSLPPSTHTSTAASVATAASAASAFSPAEMAAHAAARSAASVLIPTSSPAWLPAIVALGSRGGWARVPLPLSPPLLPTSRSSSRSSSAENESDSQNQQQQQQALPQCGDGVSQAAFAARTAGGSFVLLFFTAVLVPLADIPRSKGNESGKVGGRGAVIEAEACAWHVSIQFRTDDARVRAVAAGEVAEWVHTLFCGRLSVLAHGHSPSPTSLLQRLDLVAPLEAIPTANTTFAAATAATQDAAAGTRSHASPPVPVFDAFLHPPLISIEAFVESIEEEEEEEEEREREENESVGFDDWGAAAYKETERARALRIQYCGSGGMAV
jgi:hypothetical protein